MKIKSKRHKKSAIKRKVKFEDFKHCLEAIQLENKISQPEINNLMQIVFKKFTRIHKNNKLTLKS